jgi:hypothetical protein
VLAILTSILRERTCNIVLASTSREYKQKTLRTEDTVPCGALC